MIGFRELLQARTIARQRRFALRDDSGLSREKSIGGSLSAGLGFSNGTLVTVEDRQSERGGDSKKIVHFLILIAWTDLEIGILLGNF